VRLERLATGIDPGERLGAHQPASGKDLVGGKGGAVAGGERSTSTTIAAPTSS
jgi:hypothetical protein